MGLAILLALLIAPNLSHIGPERYYHLSPADWTPEQIARRGVSVTTREEYEPRWVSARSPYQAEKLRVVSGDAKVALLETNPVSWSAEVMAGSDSVIQSNLSYFPGWTIQVDKKNISTNVVQPSGEVRLKVPAGRHLLKLYFQRTPPEWLGEAISLVAGLFALMILFRIGWVKGERPEFQGTAKDCITGHDNATAKPGLRNQKRIKQIL